MSPPETYCELCDLPLAHCVHGLPPPPKPVAQAPPPRKRAPARPRTSTRSAPAAPATPVHRRWTPPEEFMPLIVKVLENADGELEADEMFLELEILAAESFRQGDTELTPEGEPRWQYAARRARVALIDEGVMTKGRPGMWGLTGSR